MKDKIRKEYSLMNNKDNFWSRAFISITVINFALFIGFQMLNTTFTLYISSLGGSEALAGAVACIFSVVSVAFRPVAGWLLDNAGRKWILLLSLAGMCIFSFAYSWVNVLSLAIILRLLQGVVWSAASTAPNTAVCDLIPPRRFGEAMGIFATGPALSMAIGPLLGLTIWQAAGSRPLFWLAAACCFVALILAIFGFSQKEWSVKSPSPASKTINIGSLIDKNALPVSINQLLFNMPYGAVTSFIAIYAISSGIGNSGTFFCLMAVTTVIARLFLGKMADKNLESGAVIAGCISIAIALALLGFGKSSISFMLAALIYGIGFGMVPPTMQALAMRNAPAEKRGAASSTYLCGFDIGIGLGSAVSGFLIRYTGYQHMFLAMLVFVAAAAVFFILRQRRINK